MKRIRTTGRFERRLAAFAKRHPELLDAVEVAIDSLARGESLTSLHAHRLHGDLAGCYAARIGSAYRLIFIIEDDAVGLIDIGTHDEVYR